MGLYKDRYVYCTINEWVFLSFLMFFFALGNTAPLISWGKVEKTVERMVRVTPFLLVSSCHGGVCASICLLQESTCVGLTCVASQWA
jgi:hypothetical protein